MKKFLNIRYVPKELLKSVKVYMIANGGFKECLPFVVTRKVVKPKNLYCDFDDMPKDVQDKFEDMAISEGENLSEIYFNRKGAYTFNSEGVKVVINEKTLLLPIVGNLLPSGDITPYTVLYDNGNFTLGRIYRVEENVGIWQPILCRFRDWDNPGKLLEGTIFEFAMCKFEVL